MRRNDQRTSRHIKRAIDILVGVTALFALAPAMAVIAVAVWNRLGRPVLFCQERPGHGGKLFRIYKFRTMSVDSGRSPELRSDLDRVTKLGAFLRSTSLDEWPSLVNVVKGDMSLVGPRPLLPEYLEHYSAEQARRHDVRPGLTGLAQVSGRNAISWQDRLRLDVWYVDNWSLVLDVRILCMTVWKVLKREGVNQRSDTTMEKFRGTSK